MAFLSLYSFSFIFVVVLTFFSAKGVFKIYLTRHQGVPVLSIFFNKKSIFFDFFDFFRIFFDKKKSFFSDFFQICFGDFFKFAFPSCDPEACLVIEQFFRLRIV